MSCSTKTLIREANETAQRWKQAAIQAAARKAEAARKAAEATAARRAAMEEDAVKAHLAKLQTASTSSMSDARFKLDVPYDEKDVAKASGARWDNNERTWYAPRLTENLLQWLPDGGELIALPLLQRRSGKPVPKPGFRLYDPLSWTKHRPGTGNDGRR
ncbi:UNVERIFIED_ORG: hypothetical protein BDU10_3101 [Burkholderia sp. CF145]